MVCCKLDKIDKMFISVLCIFVTFTCILNTFAFASENVNSELVELNGFYGENGVLNSNSNVSLKGVYLVPEFNERYLVINNRSAGSISIYLTEQFPGNNVKYLEKYVVNSKSDIYIDINKADYKYIYITSFIGESANLKNYIDVSKTNINGLKGAVNLLTDKVGFNIWDSFNNLLPYVLVVVTVSLGFYFILHAIREVSKGRDV